MEPGAVEIEGVPHPKYSEATLGKILVKRDGWNALPPVTESPPLEKRGLLKVRVFRNLGYPNCDTMEECMNTVQDIQRKDMARGLNDIHYNFLVGCDGYAYEGRGWYKKPPDDPDREIWKDKYIEIAFIGDQRYARHEDKVFEATAELMEYGITHGILGHDFSTMLEDEVVYEDRF